MAAGGSSMSYSEAHMRSGRMGAIAHLVDLRLRRVDAELFSPLASAPFQYEIQVAPSVFREEASHGVVYTLDYVLTATASGDEQMMKIEASLGLAYALDTTEPVDDDDLTAFGQVGVAFTAYPFF